MTSEPDAAALLAQALGTASPEPTHAGPDVDTDDPARVEAASSDDDVPPLS